MRDDLNNLWLVYRGRDGGLHRQPACDLVEVGTLIDPEDGEDMELVGFEVSE